MGVNTEHLPLSFNCDVSYRKYVRVYELISLYGGNFPKEKQFRSHLFVIKLIYC